MLHTLNHLLNKKFKFVPSNCLKSNFTLQDGAILQAAKVHVDFFICNRYL